MRVVRRLQPVAIVLMAVTAWYLHARFRADGVESSLLWHGAVGLALAGATAASGAPQQATQMSTVVSGAIAAVGIGTGLTASLLLFFPASIPRFSVLATSAMLLIWLLAVGSIGVITARLGNQADRVVAVIPAVDAESLTHESTLPGSKPFRLVSTLSDEADYPQLTELCEGGRANIVVLGPKAILSPVIIEQAEVLHRAGLRVRSLERFYDERLGKLPLSSLDSFAIMGDIESLHGEYAPLKRAIDITFAVIGALLFVALLPFVIVGNLLGNRGPLLFRQTRVGAFGSTFDIIKLRTMTPGAIDVSGWTRNDDPRITRFGKFLRRTHIDEVPQVVNIFAGDLSLVGPRPEQVGYVRQLEQALPFYSARHLVRPGLTGWAQVRYPYAASEEDAYFKLQYDLHYVRHESFTTDLRIMLLTVRHVIFGNGR